MSEARKNHLSIEEGLAKDDEHVGSYKPIPESDTVPDFRTSKSSLAKSKEKVSSDGAEEKLLAKEDEAKIATRVDMADAKYVVGDHRNGDAKIELDANQRQFSGLTKEELMKYADDPFWVRLRWFMFILFWALWLCMLAGAIAIIVRAPKCYPPPPRTWYEKGPLVDMSAVKDLSVVEKDLQLLQKSNVAGIFAHSCEEAYQVLDDPTCIEKFKDFVAKAKDVGVKVIVDLTANFVSVNHTWFQRSENKSLEYNNFFIWKPVTDFEDAENGKSVPKTPDQWMTALGDSVVAWKLSTKRDEFYLHKVGEERPVLNMTNPEVVKQFDGVIKKWMEAGAAGVRLQHGRELVVEKSLQNKQAFSQQQYTSDLPELGGLLAHWSHLVSVSGSAAGIEETVFTVAEEETRPELFHEALRPPSLAPLRVRSARDAAAALNKRLAHWPALQLLSDEAGDQELASFALLLPAAPVLDIQQLALTDNSTLDESFVELIKNRDDASIQHGTHHVASVPASNSTDELLACVRWKVGHTGYVAVYNPLEEEARANLTMLPSLPSGLNVYRMSREVERYTNYSTKNFAVPSENILVPPKSSIVLLYVPKTPVEQ